MAYTAAGTGSAVGMTLGAGMATTTHQEPETREEKQSQAQRAAHLLRDMIIYNRLPPGSNYLESELAHMLGMSRTPLREAAVILQSRGLVELRPRRGLRIRPILVQDMEEIYAVLTELESLAAYELAQRPPEAAIATLKQNIHEMEAALAADDRLAWAKADEEFHRLLVELSGNRRLAQIVATYSDQVHRARLVTLHIRPKPTQSVADHRAVVAAIEAGDAEGARSIHRNHRLRARQMLVDLIKTHGLNAV